MRKNLLVLSLISMLVIPSLAFSQLPMLSVDMDPVTPGIQSEIDVLNGQRFFTDVVLGLPDSSASISSIAYALFYDVGEVSFISAKTSEGVLNCPALGGTSNWLVPCRNVDADPDNDWFELQGFTDNSPVLEGHSLGSLKSFVQGGPTMYTLAQIEWEAVNVMNDGLMDITPRIDNAFDKDGNPVEMLTNGGRIPVVPEPISTVLFLVGGATLGARRFMKRKI